MQPAFEQDQRLLNTQLLSWIVHFLEMVPYHAQKWSGLVESILVWILWVMIWVNIVIKVQKLEDKLESVMAYSFSKDQSPVKIIGSLIDIDIRFMYNTYYYTKS